MFLAQQPITANNYSSRGGFLRAFSPDFDIIVLLAWSCEGFVQSTTAAVSGSVQ